MPRKKAATYDVSVTRFTHSEVKEPRSPETGHTSLLPTDDLVVTLPMDNGSTERLKVAQLDGAANKSVIVDMDPAQDPILLWAGKRNRKKIPVLPLQKNEIISESRIAQIIERAKKAAAQKTGDDRQGSLFVDLEKSIRESEKDRRIEFYTHDEGWKNRIICGDSLHVMESMIHYEGLRGRVQMIFVDPPYGVKYDSNFQQRVDSTKNDEKDRSDDVMTIKAFRDTWALGIHSYLSYLHERLYLCRDLLTSSGGIFVQIGAENVHFVRALMSEVFGEQNFIGQIAFAKTSSQSSEFLSSTMDYLLWYAKDKTAIKYHSLYRDKELGGQGSGQYTWIELAGGSRRRMSQQELEGIEPLPEGSRVFRPDNMCSARQGRGHEIWPIKLDGKEYWPTGASTWKTNKDGVEQLRKAKRLIPIGNTLCYVRYLDDFPAFPISNVWTDTAISGFGGDKYYVVQTNPKVLARCISMTSDAGDLVLDITCGGGTTPSVAEGLGRRWIACDLSRVAINVTRQRLLSSVYPSYQLKGPRISDGLRCRTLRRITLGTIASGQEAEEVELVDQPEIIRNSIRVTGPFEVMSIGRYSVEDWKGYVVRAQGPGPIEPAKLENYVETICRLYRKDAAIQGTSGLVHAVYESANDRIAISVGPMSGRVTAKQINDAVQDALASGILEVHVLGWAFEANVGEIKSQLEARGKVKVHLVMIRPDTLSEGLKITNAEMLFSPLALPDVEVKVTGTGKQPRQVAVTLKGVAVFDRKARSTDYKSAESGYVAAWYLDQDYDGDCFVDCQMFFEFKKAPAMRSDLKEHIEASEYKLQTTAQPFPTGTYKRIAVKVVDVFGNESTLVKDLA